MTSENSPSNVPAADQPFSHLISTDAVVSAESALTTASAELKWTNNWSVAATFEGEFSNVTSSYAGKGVVRYAW